MKYQSQNQQTSRVERLETKKTQKLGEYIALFFTTMILAFSQAIIYQTMVSKGYIQPITERKNPWFTTVYQRELEKQEIQASKEQEQLENEFKQFDELEINQITIE